MRNGQPYRAEDPAVVAVADVLGWPVIPLGTELEICRDDICIDAVVQDTGLFPPNHLDLSEAAFEKLGALPEGRLKGIIWRMKGADNGRE